MITNIIKDNKGYTIQFTETSDNCTTKIENYLHKHFCMNCNTNIDKMKFIKETGYIDRTVTMQCKCGTIVKYHG